MVNSGERLLPEVPFDLAEFTLKSLRENGVEIMLNTRVSGATADSVILNNGSAISCHTLIWTGGIGPDNLISKITGCSHDKSGKIMTNNHLQVRGLNNVFSIGDCAFIADPNSGKSCPPTAQHAIKQAKVASQNLISIIQEEEERNKKNEGKNRKYNGHKNPIKMMVFDYKTKGIMALIGKKNGVGVLLGYKIHGFLAWWIWRLYYLGNLPTSQKKIGVMVDWGVDLLFKRDVTRLQINFKRKYSQSNE
ncbi:MAG: FAD-dependent oxidoreductase [Candidatus Nitrosocosmicus sp.]